MSTGKARKPLQGRVALGLVQAIVTAIAFFVSLRHLDFGDLIGTLELLGLRLKTLSF